MSAADLPDGSIVATDTKAWIKTRPTGWSPWRSTSGSYEADTHVDDALNAGAAVLRRGYGHDRRGR